MSLEDFREANLQYIQDKLDKRRTDPHWETMLQEIADDVARNRMTGPYHGPPEWKKKMVAAPQFERCNQLLPGPETHQATSVAFSIIQVGSGGQDKVRRGEDWKRGGQNSTVVVDDAPVNPGSGTFLGSAAAVAANGHTPVLWGTDQADAYRQLPLKEPSEAWMIHFAKTGPTLWRHNALLFGATASVWAYGRTADLLCWIARCFLMVGAVHFVDDFAALEASGSVRLQVHTPALGGIGIPLQRHEEAATCQLPSHPRNPHVLLQPQLPDPPRMHRTCAKILEILQENAVDPDEAAKLAGKIQFLSETLIGQAVKSCMMPLYNSQDRAVRGAQRQPSDPSLPAEPAQPKDLPVRPQGPCHHLRRCILPIGRQENSPRRSQAWRHRCRCSQPLQERLGLCCQTSQRPDSLRQRRDTSRHGGSSHLPPGIHLRLGNPGTDDPADPAAEPSAWDSVVLV